MLAYGIIQLGSTFVSAIALVSIALGLPSIQQQSKAFKDCVEEAKGSGSNVSQAVRFCNGGN